MYIGEIKLILGKSFNRKPKLTLLPTGGGADFYPTP